MMAIHCIDPETGDTLARHGVTADVTLGWIEDMARAYGCDIEISGYTPLVQGDE